VVNIFKAILPDPLAGEFAPICTLVAVIADKIRSWRLQRISPA